MAESARGLVRLHDLLVPSLGEEGTNELLEYLPPVKFGELATKSDLRTLEQSLRGELRSEIGAVRQEIGTLRGEFGELRGEFGVAHVGSPTVATYSEPS